jgi:hypothetical protein
MKTRFLPHLGLRQQQHLLQALLLLVLAIPCIALATWLWGKHQSWQNNLQRQEAMYARLTGIQAQQTDIALALEQAQQQASLYLFPAEGEPEATATAALQQLRQAIDGIGVKVTSSQIKHDLQEDEAQPYQRLQLLLSLDGKWSDIQLALAALRDIRPLLWVDKVQISLKTRLQSANPEVEQTLGVELAISLYKAKALQP